MISRRTTLSFLPLLAVARIVPARAAEEPPPEYFQKHMAPPDADFFVVLVDKREKGERMVVRGVVTDGEKPIPNASIYVYHTDADGRYDPLEPRPGEGAENARLHGYMRTDSTGRYVFESIRPAPYPNTPLPAHVHYVVSADGFKSRAFEFWFEGDPMIKEDHLKAAAARPDHFYIRPAIKSEAKVWHVTFDIVLERL